MSNKYAVGHFHDLGYKPGKAHLITKSDNKPVCGREVEEDFQWIANGVQLRYITCEQCKLKAQKLQMVFAGLE